MILLLVSFVAGVLTVLAPCILPLLPVIVGGSIGGGRSLNRAITVTASLAVSVIVFTLLIKASTLLIDIPQAFWLWFSGGIIIAFGLILLFPFLWERLPFLTTLNIGSNRLLSSGYQKQNFFGDVIVGAALGPVFSTCSPTYFLVLAAVLPGNLGLGMLYLLAYAAGLSLALLAIALVGQRIVEKVGLAADPHGWFKKSLGVLFLLVGIAIISGADKALQVRLLDAGFFDVTKIEQWFLEFVPSSEEGVRENSTETADKITKTGAMSLVQKAARYTLAPEISSPDGFVNTDGMPITLEELRGKIVLLDIWTYSCINCQRTLPYLNEWYAKYKDLGLEIVGLHTPEFAFERLQKNVEEAAERFGVQYPIVLDNDYSTWNAYGNRYWPRKYLIDADGFVVYDHIGEGAYEETEMKIQELLQERAQMLGEEYQVEQGLVSATMVREQNFSKSPETYFGSLRNEYLGNGYPGQNGEKLFIIPNTLQRNALYLGGSWRIESEYAESGKNASIQYKYSAKEVYIVAESEEPVSIEVWQDETLLKTISIRESTLYTLISNDTPGEHALELRVPSEGVRFYAFTFG